MSNETKENKSKRLSYAEEGLLNAAYTLNKWFVKIKPVYNIDKVKFCFVLKGTGSSKSFDVYMDLDEFDLWMDDVMSYRMKSTIDAEAANGEKYPKTYKFITGDNGALSVGLCKSSENDGYVINGQGKHKENGAYTGETLKAFVPVSYNWLRITAKWFRRTSSKRFEFLADTIITESAKYVPSEETTLDNKEAIPETQNDKTNHSSRANTSTKAENTKPEKSAPDVPVSYKDEQTKKMDVHSLTPIVRSGNDYKLQVKCHEDGNSYNVIILSADADKMGEQFTNLKKACDASHKENKHSDFTMYYKEGTYNSYSVLLLTNIATSTN